MFMPNPQSHPEPIVIPSTIVIPSLQGLLRCACSIADAIAYWGSGFAFSAVTWTNAGLTTILRWRSG